jgi:hypothetical protein
VPNANSNATGPPHPDTSNTLDLVQHRRIVSKAMGPCRYVSEALKPVVVNVEPKVGPARKKRSWSPCVLALAYDRGWNSNEAIMSSTECHVGGKRASISCLLGRTLTNPKPRGMRCTSTSLFFLRHHFNSVRIDPLSCVSFLILLSISSRQLPTNMVVQF